MKTILCTTILFYSSLFLLNAQTFIGTSSNSSGEQNIHLTWSIGETFVQTSSTQSIVLTEGMQQPLIMIEKVTKDIAIKGISIFPNPSDGNIYLQIEEMNTVSYELSIHNAQGVLVQQIPNVSTALDLDLTNYPSGIYLLKIQQNDRQEIFKIIKK